MANLVQQRIEEGLAEIQEMKEMHLFEDCDLKQIIKRRTNYEYRVQRRAQVKDDFLKYIEYEMNLYALVKMKCRRQRIQTDIKPILHKISQRVKRLYSQAIARFKDDVKLWLEFINFARELNWNVLTSNTLTSLLKVHCDKPELWIMAAKWESENNNKFNLARKLMMRGLRFSPNSKKLYLELFYLELCNIRFQRKDAAMKARLKKQTERQVKDDEKSEAEPEKSKELRAIMSGAVAKAVYQNAVRNMPDASFVLSFIKISRSFTFADQLTNFLYGDLIVRFPNDEIAWEAVAIRPLYKEKDGSEMHFECVEVCLTIFNIAVKAVNTEKMWSLYLGFCLNQLKKILSDHKAKLEIQVLDVFANACKNSHLNASNFMHWYNLASGNEDSDQRCKEILNIGLEKFPQDFQMWCTRVRRTLKNGDPTEISEVLNKALVAVKPEECHEIMALALRWYMATGRTDKVKQLYETALNMPSAVSAVLKVEYIEWMAKTEGVPAAFKLFKRIWSISPICKEIMYKMCDLELTKVKPSMSHLHEVMEYALNNFGKSDADVWIYFIKLERQHSGEIGGVARLYSRAIKMLEPHLVDEFITHFTLLNTLGGL